MCIFLSTKFLLYNIFLLDFVVGAPYEPSGSSSTSTGAVYVYYGRDTREDLVAQQPQKVACIVPAQYYVLYCVLVLRFRLMMLWTVYQTLHNCALLGFLWLAILI